MQILLIIVCCAMCGLMSGAFMGYKSYSKGYADGKAEAQRLVDKDGLTKEEKEQLRQVINVLSRGGGNEN